MNRPHNSLTIGVAAVRRLRRGIAGVRLQAFQTGVQLRRQ